jgi:putative ABC transport system ATP-binding protein
MIAITGVSGSGKSTLLHIIGLLDQQTAGSVSLLDTDPSKMSDSKRAKLRNREIGFVLQDFALIPTGRRTGNVEVPLIFAGKKRKNAGSASGSVRRIRDP